MVIDTLSRKHKTSYELGLPKRFVHSTMSCNQFSSAAQCVKLFIRLLVYDKRKGNGILLTARSMLLCAVS